MDSITNENNNYPAAQPPSLRGESTDFNIEAHTTSNMKLKRPKITNSVPPPLIQTKHLYRPSDAEQYLKKLNTDIYEGTKKEKSTNEFNFKRYFTIFGIVALITAAIAYFRRGK